VSNLGLGYRKEGIKILAIMLCLLLDGFNNDWNCVRHESEEFLREYRLPPRETKALSPTWNKGVPRNSGNLAILVEIFLGTF
jgi:hypothetical protein